MKFGGVRLALAVVRDLRELRAPATDEELADYETDLLAGFVLARASAMVGHLLPTSRRETRPFLRRGRCRREMERLHLVRIGDSLVRPRRGALPRIGARRPRSWR